MFSGTTATAALLLWKNLIESSVIPEIQHLVSLEHTNYYFVVDNSGSNNEQQHQQQQQHDVTTQMNFTRPVSHFLAAAQPFLL